MRTRRGLVRGAMLLAIALVSAACATGGRDKLASDERSRAADGTGEPTEAAKPVSNLVLTSQRTGSLRLSRPITAAAKGAFVPTVATDPRSGAIYTAWAQEVPGGADLGRHGVIQSDVMVARSDDGGRTFSDPVVASGPDDKVSAYAVSPPQVRVGPEGSVYVVYGHAVERDFGVSDWGTSGGYLHLVRSGDGGRTFSAPVEVAPEATEGVVTVQGMGGFFVAPDGDLFVSWLDFRNKLDPQLRPSLKEDDGQRYGPAKATELRVARSGDEGRRFGRSTLAGSPTCNCCGTHLAQGEEGPLFVTTRSAFVELKGSLDEVRDQFVAASPDDGATWSDPVKVHDDGFIFSSCPDITAGMAVDSKGRLHYAWVTGTEAHPGFFYAVSDDDAKTFSKPLTLLTDDFVPFGDVKLAVDGDDRAWVAFEDRRGDEDVIRMVLVDPDRGTIRTARAWAGSNPDIVATGAGEALVAWETGDGETRKSIKVATVRSGF